MERNRTVLETLKFLSAPDILSSTSLVNKHFSKLSDSVELWEELLSAREHSSSLPATPSAKQLFRRLHCGYVPVVRDCTLRKFIVHSRSWESVELTKTIAMQPCVSITQLRDGNLFITGVQNVTENTLQIDPLTGKVTVLPSLITPRGNIGVISCDKNVYALCGYNGLYLYKCEYFHTETGKWTELPDALSPRAAFNPTLHRDKIYLIGGWSSGASEVFDVITQTFEALHLTVAANQGTVNVCRGEEFVAFQQHGFYRWTLGSGEQSRFVRSKFDLGVANWSSFDVFEQKGLIYIFQAYNKRIVSVHLNTFDAETFACFNT